MTPGPGPGLDYETIDAPTRDTLNRYARRALANRATVWTTYLLARECERRGLLGDFAECGVFAGAQVAAMALPSKYRTIHLFDSFAGIPEAGPEDDRSITDCIGEGRGRLVSTGVSACAVEQVKAHMAEWGVSESRLVYHAGWFQDTLPIAVPRIGALALLRLDGDLYESTRVCLDYLAGKVIRGGFIVVDDYALTGCRKAVDRHLSRAGLMPRIVEIPGGDGPVFWEVA